MNDLSQTIIPKSDQLNADDMIGGRTITITISGVDVMMAEQPVSLHFEGDNGKPYKPGKSMRRVLVNAWGADGNVYVGRRLTLYRDETVKFGGLEVGGIRISHMSHIKGPMTMALTATRAQRKPFTVQPLPEEKPRTTMAENDLLPRAELAASEGTSAYLAFWKALNGRQQKVLLAQHDRLKSAALAADARRMEQEDPEDVPFDSQESAASDKPVEDDDFPGDLPSRDAA